MGRQRGFIMSFRLGFGSGVGASGVIVLIGCLALGGCPRYHVYQQEMAGRAKLAEALAPARIDILDESERHRGHAGHDGRGESHFRVTIVSPAFAGRSRLERQRLVHAILAEELAGRVHALALTTRTPEEAAATTATTVGRR